MIQTLFSRRWIVATILVVVASLVMVRLGIWQYNRWQQRIVFNERLLRWVEAETLALTGSALDEDLYNMEYRIVEVTGKFVHDDQVALRLRQWGPALGVSLITPLVIEDSSRAILVERGWIPMTDFESGDWSQFDVPGTVTIRGRLRRGQEASDITRLVDPTLTPDQTRLESWYVVNVRRIDEQTAMPLLPDVYLMQMPEGDNSTLPYRIEPDIEISEGSHQGYMLQWFTFATILLVGYPFFVRNQEQAAMEENNTAEEIG